MINAIIAGGRLGGSVAFDPAWDHVGLLLHAEGAPGTNTFVDSSSRPKTPVYVGGAKLSSAQKKYGNTSILIASAADRLQYAEHEDFGTGAGPFTAEAWVRLTDVTSYINNVFDTRSSSHTGVGLWVGGGRYGLPQRQIGYSSNTTSLAMGGTIPTDGSFVHCRWTRDANNVMRGFINGTLAFEHTDNRTLASAAPLVVGADAFGTSDQVSFGYIDEARFAKGVDRGGGLPTAPFPNRGP